MNLAEGSKPKEEVLAKTKSPVRRGKQIPTRTELETVGSTRWLSLKTITYVDEDGKSRKWDTATRSTKQKNVPDAVVIVPILKSSKTHVLDTLLVEQYRPPVQAYALEFPAGLIDKGETAEQAALRELWEETGYVGTVDETFSKQELSMSPGLSDETIEIVVVHVDLDDPKNDSPKQNLEETESIVVKRVPLTVGLKAVLEKSECMPISLLYSFAVGLEMGAKLFGK